MRFSCVENAGRSTLKLKFHLARDVSTRSTCRAVSFDKLDTAKMHGLDVSSRVET